MNKKPSRQSLQWRTMDIHIHTPASEDFQQPEVSYLEILQRAEARSLDIIAFTDHNTIAGFRQMIDELHQLEFLEKTNRLLSEEKARLVEYHRLMDKVLVLPGIEFTATFGFHIIGLFPPTKPTREIEHLLLGLNIPPELLDKGSATVGATTDVLTAYRMINQAGGIVIAAHSNSSNGVAMRGFNFGGQTKIAYTQDANLHALEVTDLDQRGPRSTASFFNGTKPEYPRRMHCIQGSDSHRLFTDSSKKKVFGIGDRACDVLLPEVSFDALKALFLGNDFSRTRPHHHREEPAYQFILGAREEGPNIIQDFHESMTLRGGKILGILADICAFANTNGGSLYIGLSAEISRPIIGIQSPEQSILSLEKEITQKISPQLQCSLDIHEVKGKKIIRILVPRGDDPPYAVDDNKIFIRNEEETALAVRDEIVGLIQKNLKSGGSPRDFQGEAAFPQRAGTISKPLPEPELKENYSPHTGVEVVNSEERQSKRYFTMRDLRNGNIVKNVTQSSARRLWHYAILAYTDLAPRIDQINIKWVGDYGLVRSRKQGNGLLYDFVQRTSNAYRYYFGVTADGIHGPWKAFVEEEEI